jgi:hypothetical protein
LDVIVELQRFSEVQFRQPSVIAAVVVSFAEFTSKRCEPGECKRTERTKHQLSAGHDASSSAQPFKTSNYSAKKAAFGAIISEYVRPVPVSSLDQPGRSI